MDRVVMEDMIVRITSTFLDAVRQEKTHPQKQRDLHQEPRQGEKGRDLDIKPGEISIDMVKDRYLNPSFLELKEYLERHPDQKLLKVYSKK